MELILVRHAIAFERDPERWPDDGERPLTAAGRRRFREAARGLARVVAKPDQVFTSPLLRARQTARLLEKFADWPKAQELAALAENVKWRDLRGWIGDEGRIAIVGHEPHLSTLGTELLAPESKESVIELKKGAAARFEVATSGTGALLLGLWAPRVLRSAGR